METEVITIGGHAAIMDLRGVKMRTVQTSIVIVGLFFTLSANAQNNKAPKVEPLPRDLEIQLALSALPPHLRDNATVYVLNSDKGVLPEGFPWPASPRYQKRPASGPWRPLHQKKSGREYRLDIVSLTSASNEGVESIRALVGTRVISSASLLRIRRHAV